MFINSNLNLNFHSFLFSNKFQHQQPFFQESKSFRNEQNVVDPKYKTELCKKFAEIGKCPYGNKCRFAHGKRELVVKMKNSNYKKKYCKTISEIGFCPYGERCSFKHDERGLNEIKLPFYFVNLYLKNIIDANHKRLSIFENITNSYEHSNINNNNYSSNCKNEGSKIVHSSSTSTSAISNDESNSNSDNDNDEAYTQSF